MRRLALAMVFALCAVHGVEAQSFPPPPVPPGFGPPASADEAVAPSSGVHRLSFRPVRTAPDRLPCPSRCALRMPRSVWPGIRHSSVVPHRQSRASPLAGSDFNRRSSFVRLVATALRQSSDVHKATSDGLVGRHVVKLRAALLQSTPTATAPLPYSSNTTIAPIDAFFSCLA